MSTPSALQHLSIVIIDDDDFIVDVMQSILEDMGVGHVTTYTSAHAALENLAMNNPDLVVLCDLNMPEFDGVEVIRHLGQNNFPGAVIVLSGEDSRTLQTVAGMGRSYHLRLLGALEKPVDPNKLLDLLQKSTHAKASSPKAASTLLSEDDIRNGLKLGALLPYYQPQVDAHTRKVVGVEALARWQHPQHGIIGPEHFIPLAENTDLIATLTAQMLQMSLKQVRQWQEQHLDLHVSVNISMHSIIDIGFPDWLVTQAEEIGAPLNRLVLEITESNLPVDVRVAADVLTRLCLKRLRLSLDDFGTAYSNMEKLSMLPFNELKIDRVFVHDAALNASTFAILKASAELGKRLGMTIVAEGVESQQDWDTAAQVGCGLIQGYYVARPMAAEALGQWLQDWK